MYHHELLRKHALLLPRIARVHRFSSTNSNPSKRQHRINRVLDRLPSFLHPYTSGLRNAPVSHIASFLVLHELTAVIPLIALAGAFHYTQWLPQRFVEGKWVSEGVEKFGRYFGRKGWFGIQRTDGQEGGEALEGQTGDALKAEERKWVSGDSGRRILVEVATAYAVTKVLLPIRILFSVWATPWFARVVLGPIRRLVRRGGK